MIMAISWLSFKIKRDYKQSYIMRNFEIEKGQDLIQKQKSYSTSSFYRPRSQTKMIIKNNTQIGVRLEHEERQVQQQIEKLKLAINFKIEYVEKRQNQTIQENQKNVHEILQLQKNMTQKIKNIQRNDRTKEWNLEMEKTIRTVISNNIEGNKKNYDKNHSDCKKQEIKYFYFNKRCNQLEDKVRQQKKQREKEWEELIDNVGETIIEAEELIEEQRYSMEVKISEIESKVLDIEQYTILCLQQQKNNRKHEHEYLTKLIQRIMEKLLH